MKNRLLILGISSVLGSMILTSSFVAAKAYKLGTFPIPLMVESKDKGIFIDLTKEVAKRAGIELEIIVEPAKRITNGFEKNEVDILYPGLDVTMPIPVEKTSPVYMKTDYVFYKSDTPYRTLADLKGKKVGITNGYPYVKEVTENKSFIIEAANDDVTNMKKLEAGRVDAFIVEERSGVKALEESKAQGVVYDKGQALSNQEVFYAFQKTPEGKDLADKFSKALDDMKKDGTFAKILGGDSAGK